MTEDAPSRRITLIFFRTAAGSEPVRDWLKALPEAERHAKAKICYVLSGGGQSVCRSAAQ
jgi:hypothetical protein